MSTNIFAFIVVLGILIFAHEFGHFIVARLCGVGVEKFSLGFGPRLIGKKIGITDYRISAIPLGGYVKMVGDEPDADADPKTIHLSFTHKHVFKRILVVSAGPFFNLLLAVIIFFGIFAVSGTFILRPTIGNVGEGTPAEAVGLQTGDTIITIGGTPIESWAEMAAQIGAGNGASLNLSVKRGDGIIQLQVKPQLISDKNIFGEDIDRYVIGITSSNDVFTKELSLFEALTASIFQTYNITRLTIVSVVKIIRGSLSAKTLGGPIMIAELAGEHAKAGTENFIFFIALLSINLAILNFLPIPVLDGGHLFFFLIEVIIRRPVSVKVREIAQQAGMFILILLMVLVFYNDITRFFFN